MGFDQNLRLQWASSCRCDAKLPGRLGGCAQEIHLKNILDYCTYVCKSDTKQYILGVFGRWKHTFLYEFFFGKHSELLQYTMETPDAAFKTQINEWRIFWELDFQKFMRSHMPLNTHLFVPKGGFFNDECYCLGTIDMLHSPQPTTEPVEVSQRVPWTSFFSFVLPSCLW